MLSYFLDFSIFSIGGDLLRLRFRTGLGLGFSLGLGFGTWSGLNKSPRADVDCFEISLVFDGFSFSTFSGFGGSGFITGGTIGVGILTDCLGGFLSIGRSSSDESLDDDKVIDDGGSMMGCGDILLFLNKSLEIEFKITRWIKILPLLLAWNWVLSNRVQYQAVFVFLQLYQDLLEVDHEVF